LLTQTYGEACVMRFKMAVGGRLCLVWWSRESVRSQSFIDHSGNPGERSPAMRSMTLPQHGELCWQAEPLHHITAPSAPQLHRLHLRAVDTAHGWHRLCLTLCSSQQMSSLHSHSSIQCHVQAFLNDKPPSNVSSEQTRTKRGYAPALFAPNRLRFSQAQLVVHEQRWN